jgi:hypothetical protein
MLKVKLTYNGKDYVVKDKLESLDTTYIWREGNYACDCNRALFIQRQCDPEFPDMECGNQIKLKAIQ